MPINHIHALSFFPLSSFNHFSSKYYFFLNKSNKMAPPLTLTSKKKPRNRTWDREQDLYLHLTNSTTPHQTQNHNFNFFNNLLNKFVINDPNADSELTQFTNSSSSILQSHLLHLQHQNEEKEEEETITEDEDEQHNRCFLDYFKPHGNSHVLEIVEDGVFVKYEDESVCGKRKGEIRVRKSKGVKKRFDFDANCVGSRKGSSKGMKSKGAKFSDASNSSDVALEGYENARKRVKKNEGNVNGEEEEEEKKGVLAVKEEIQDYDDADDDAIRILEKPDVNDLNARKVAEFREKLADELNRPFCEEERRRLLEDFMKRKRVQKHKDLRGVIKIYEEDLPGKAYSDHSHDLAKEIETACDDAPKVLRLLRGFFFWLSNIAHEGGFMPWAVPSCLDVLPQQ